MNITNISNVRDLSTEPTEVTYSNPVITVVNQSVTRRYVPCITTCEPCRRDCCCCLLCMFRRSISSVIGCRRCRCQAPETTDCSECGSTCFRRLNS